MKPIYLDYNASTPIKSEVAEIMMPLLTDFFGNPSSSHWYGKNAKNIIEIARNQIAKLLNCNSSEIIFTSGGTESNNYAIKGYAFANQSKGNHIITSSIEHPAVIEVCKYLETKGFKITYLPVNEFGIVSIDDVNRAINDQTILITIMHANNEVGSIQPIEEIAQLAKKNNIVIHTDAAQSTGKIETDVNKLGVDMLSIAGHKLYAPKGIGILFKKNNIELEKFMHGADHESNRRAGTENIIEIAGLGKACELAHDNMGNNYLNMKMMRDLLQSGIEKLKYPVKVNGHPEKRLPNTLSISFKDVEANNLLAAIPEIAASSGSACHSDSIKISSVLSAMKVPLEYAMGTIRFSTGYFTKKDEILEATTIIKKAFQNMKDFS